MRLGARCARPIAASCHASCTCARPIAAACSATPQLIHRGPRQIAPARSQHGHRLSARSCAAAAAGVFKSAMASGAKNSAAAAPGCKVLHILRHGETEMNVWLGGVPDGAPYDDPQLYDTVLTKNGKRQAAAAAMEAKRLAPPPELIICSPLTRALQTAELAFQDVGCPRIVSPLAAERIYHASDVGQERSALEAAWAPKWSFDGLPSGAWWHTSQPNDLKHVSEQTDEEFAAQLVKLRGFISARPERSIALVCHWGVALGLTGRSFRNCEFQSITLAP